MSLLRIITIVHRRTHKSFLGRMILKIAEGVTTLLSDKSQKLTFRALPGSEVALNFKGQLRTQSSPPPGGSYRSLTENDSRYCGLSILRTPNYVPRASAITRVDCNLPTTGV